MKSAWPLCLGRGYSLERDDNDIAGMLVDEAVSSRLRPGRFHTRARGGGGKSKKLKQAFGAKQYAKTPLRAPSKYSSWPTHSHTDARTPAIAMSNTLT